MQRKKILHLISGLEIGGTETQLLRILPELEKHHSSAVCCVRGRGPIGIELEKKGIPVYYLELKGFSDLLLVIKRFYSVVKKFHPDILVTYLIHADLYGRVFGRLFRIKKIVCSKRGALLQWEWLAKFDRLTKFMVTHYLVQTKTAQLEWMTRLKLPENKFTIVPNGMHTELFSLKSDRPSKSLSLKINPNSLIITCVARLRIGKDHETLLTAFEEIFNKNPAIELLLVGDGEQEKKLREQIRLYSSKNNIHFLGNRTDVVEILSISDIFVLPTEAEGMSNAIMEAMTTGLPIITTDLSENRDILTDNETGILFQVKNTKSLAEKISLLQNNPQLRKEIGKNAQEKAQTEFDIEKIVLRLNDFYEKL